MESSLCDKLYKLLQSSKVDVDAWNQMKSILWEGEIEGQYGEKWEEHW